MSGQRRPFFALKKETYEFFSAVQYFLPVHFRGLQDLHFLGKILLPIKNEWELDSANQLAEIRRFMQKNGGHFDPRTITSISEITQKLRFKEAAGFRVAKHAGEFEDKRISSRETYS